MRYHVHCAKIRSLEIGGRRYAKRRSPGRAIRRTDQQTSVGSLDPSEAEKTSFPSRQHLQPQPDPNPQLAAELLQILSDVYSEYPALVAQHAIQTLALESLTSIINTGRISIRKRAVPALSSLVTTDPKLFAKSLKGRIIEGLSRGGEGARIWVAVVASLARGQAVAHVGSLVAEGKLVGMILAQCDKPEETEAVEGSLSVSVAGSSDCEC